MLRFSDGSSQIITAIALSLALAGCAERALEPLPNAPIHDTSKVKAEVEQFCGHCHATPNPESFPRDRWAHEVDRGFQFYLLSGKADLRLPHKGRVINYYQSLAPERLQLPVPPEIEQPAAFDRFKLTWADGVSEFPAIAHLLPLEKCPTAGFMVCDMRSGLVSHIVAEDQQVRAQSSARLSNPAHVCATDLDQDGVADFVIADLGSFLPEDHQRGKVVWLKRGPNKSDFEQTVLLEGVGRIADVQSADVDGDDDLDLLVAVFGWQTSGELVLLRQDHATNGIPHFTRETLDQRTGAIHVCITSLNGDEHPDLVVLFSQEHETVTGFINLGAGKFEKVTIYQAPDPSYGSSGIQVVDLDQDGDMDVLYTNGDTFDSFYVKPYHSVRWIEHRGADEWIDHRLAQLPGVHRALAGDLDGDGDLDIAACVLIPQAALARHPEAESLASLVWLENRSLQFTLHSLEVNNPIHATLEIADVDCDGALDIVVGNFISELHNAVAPPFEIWRGASVSPSAR